MAPFSKFKVTSHSDTTKYWQLSFPCCIVVACRATLLEGCAVFVTPLHNDLWNIDTLYTYPKSAFVSLKSNNEEMSAKS